MVLLRGLVAFAIVGALSLPSLSAQRRDSTLHEASANFDLEDVAPFLARVVALVDSGFTAGDAKTLADRIGKQPIDSEREYRYSIVAAGVRGALVIRAFMDDVDAPDLYFFANKALADRIDAAMEKYFEEVGK